MHTLSKTERLNKQKAIDKLFAGKARSFSLFPLRVVYLPLDELEAQAAILVSVPKKRFKRAVKRNRVKRQIREAYRLSKHILLPVLQQQECRLAIAFIYLSDSPATTKQVEERMALALTRIAEQLPTDRPATRPDPTHTTHED